MPEVVLECNGLCVAANDLVQGVSGIAYAHPQCPLHSWDWLYDPVENEEDLAAQRAPRDQQSEERISD